MNKCKHGLPSIENNCFFPYSWQTDKSIKFQCMFFTLKRLVTDHEQCAIRHPKSSIAHCYKKKGNRRKNMGMRGSWPPIPHHRPTFKSRELHALFSTGHSFHGIFKASNWILLLAYSIYTRQSFLSFTSKSVRVLDIQSRTLNIFKVKCQQYDETMTLFTAYGRFLIKMKAKLKINILWYTTSTLRIKQSKYPDVDGQF